MKCITKWRYRTGERMIEEIVIEIDANDGKMKIEKVIKKRLSQVLKYENKAIVVESDCRAVPVHLMYSVSERYENDNPSYCEVCGRELLSGEYIIISPTMQKVLCHPCYVKQEMEWYKWLMS